MSNISPAGYNMMIYLKQKKMKIKALMYNNRKYKEDKKQLN